MRAIMTKWKCFSKGGVLKEAPNNSLCPNSETPNAPSDVVTIGELYNFILAKEPGKLRKFVAGASKAASKIAGVAAGVAVDTAAGGATGGGASGIGGAVGNALASEVVEMLLTNAAVYFANIPDADVDEGSVAWYFDHNDQIQMFLRGQEQGEIASSEMSKIERRIFKEMSAYVKSAISTTTDCDETVASILGGVTARAKMSAALADGDVGGGKVKIQPME